MQVNTSSLSQAALIKDLPPLDLYLLRQVQSVAKKEAFFFPSLKGEDLKPIEELLNERISWMDARSKYSTTLQELFENILTVIQEDTSSKLIFQGSAPYYFLPKTYLQTLVTKTFTSSSQEAKTNIQRRLEAKKKTPKDLDFLIITKVSIQTLLAQLKEKYQKKNIDLNTLFPSSKRLQETFQCFELPAVRNWKHVDVTFCQEAPKTGFYNDNLYIDLKPILTVSRQHTCASLKLFSPSQEHFLEHKITASFGLTAEPNSNGWIRVLQRIILKKERLILTKDWQHLSEGLKKHLWRKHTHPADDLLSTIQQRIDKDGILKEESLLLYFQVLLFLDEYWNELCPFFCKRVYLIFQNEELLNLSTPLYKLLVSLFHNEHNYKSLLAKLQAAAHFHLRFSLKTSNKVKICLYRIDASLAELSLRIKDERFAIWLPEQPSTNLKEFTKEDLALFAFLIPPFFQCNIELFQTFVKMSRDKQRSIEQLLSFVYPTIQRDELLHLFQIYATKNSFLKGVEHILLKWKRSEEALFLLHFSFKTNLLKEGAYYHFFLKQFSQKSLDPKKEELLSIIASFSDELLIKICCHIFNELDDRECQIFYTKLLDKKTFLGCSKEKLVFFIKSCILQLEIMQQKLASSWILKLLAEVSITIPSLKALRLQKEEGYLLLKLAPYIESKQLLCEEALRLDLLSIDLPWFDYIPTASLKDQKRLIRNLGPKKGLLDVEVSVLFDTLIKSDDAFFTKSLPILLNILANKPSYWKRSLQRIQQLSKPLEAYDPLIALLDNHASKLSFEVFILALELWKKEHHFNILKKSPLFQPQRSMKGLELLDLMLQTYKTDFFPSLLEDISFDEADLLFLKQRSCSNEAKFYAFVHVLTCGKDSYTWQEKCFELFKTDKNRNAIYLTIMKAVAEQKLWNEKILLAIVEEEFPCFTFFSQLLLCSDMWPSPIRQKFLLRYLKILLEKGEKVFSKELGGILQQIRRSESLFLEEEHKLWQKNFANKRLDDLTCFFSLFHDCFKQAFQSGLISPCLNAYPPPNQQFWSHESLSTPFIDWLLSLDVRERLLDDVISKNIADKKSKNSLGLEDIAFFLNLLETKNFTHPPCESLQNLALTLIELEETFLEENIAHPLYQALSYAFSPFFSSSNPTVERTKQFISIRGHINRLAPAKLYLKAILTKAEDGNTMSLINRFYECFQDQYYKLEKDELCKLIEEWIERIYLDVDPYWAWRWNKVKEIFAHYYLASKLKLEVKEIAYMFLMKYTRSYVYKEAEAYGVDVHEAEIKAIEILLPIHSISSAAVLLSLLEQCHMRRSEKRLYHHFETFLKANLYSPWFFKGYYSQDIYSIANRSYSVAKIFRNKRLIEMIENAYDTVVLNQKVK